MADAKPPAPVRQTPRPRTRYTKKSTGQEVEAERTEAEIKLEARRKAKEAAELRIKRYSWAYIAEAVGFKHPASAHRAVQKYLDRLPMEAVDDLRKLELESLDEAEKALQDDIAGGDPQAIAVMLRVKEQRAKLTGLYETAGGDTINTELMKVQIANELARLMKAHPDMPTAELIKQVTRR